MSAKNGSRILTKADLADRSRFQFREEKLELPEIGGAIRLKSLSVKERDDLPEMINEDGSPDVSIPKLAAVFAVAVVEPELDAQEAEEFLGDWPASALDKVIEKFGELAGSEKERSAAAGRFPAEQS